MDPQIIGVEFKNGFTVYSFICYDEVKIGDLVVVDTKNGEALAEVVEIPSDCSKATREVIAVVDTTAFKARREKAERIEALRKKMDEKVRNLQNLAVYELLAKQDSELAEMLDELKGLL